MSNALRNVTKLRLLSSKILPLLPVFFLSPFIVPVWGISRFSIEALFDEVGSRFGWHAQFFVLITIFLVAFITFFKKEVALVNNYIIQNNLNSTKKSDWFTFPLWLLMLIWCVPGIIAGFSSLRKEAEITIYSFILFPTVVGCLSALCTTPKVLASIVVLLATVQAGGAIFFFHDSEHVLISGQTIRLCGTLSPITLSHLMIVAIPLSLSLAVTQRSNWLRLVFIICSSLLLTALVLTYTLGAMLALCCIVPCLIWLFMRRKSVVWVVGLLVICLFCFIAFKRTEGAINRASTDRSVNGRWIALNQGIITFSNNWLTGVGIGNVQIPVLNKSSFDNTIKYTVLSEPKNLVLFFLCERGIGGGIFIVIFFLVLSNRYLLFMRLDPIFSGYLCGLIGFAVAGSVDTPFGPMDRFSGNAIAGSLLGVAVVGANKFYMEARGKLQMANTTLYQTS